MNRKIDDLLEKAGLAGEKSGNVLRKIFNKQFMIIFGTLILLVFGTLAFLSGMAAGAIKKK